MCSGAGKHALPRFWAVAGRYCCETLGSGVFLGAGSEDHRQPRFSESFPGPRAPRGRVLPRATSLLFELGWRRGARLNCSPYFPITKHKILWEKLFFRALICLGFAPGWFVLFLKSLSSAPSPLAWKGTCTEQAVSHSLMALSR